MSVSFDTQINEKDLYRFNMRMAYTSMSGILSLLFAVFIVGVMIFSDSMQDATTAPFYILIAIFLVAATPISLYFQSKQRIKTNEVFSKPLHYELADEGIVVSSELVDEPDTLPWEYIYKIKTTKDYIYIYSSRQNAFIIPKEQVAEQVDTILTSLEAKLPEHKLQIKR